MGADMGDSRGDITLQTVDVTGRYMPGTAKHVPGLALGTGLDFPGDVTIRGLNVEDAPQAGVLLTLAGSAIIEDVSATGNGLFGIVIHSTDVSVRRTTSNGNGYGGVAIFASSNVEVTDSAANDNQLDEDADGFRIAAGGDVDATDPDGQQQQ